MESETLGSALEREHREIDGGIEEYTAGLKTGRNDTTPLVRAMTGLRRHIYLEEVFLFPPLKEAGMGIQLFVMLRQHGQLWKAMDGLDSQLSEKASPDAVMTACRDLLALLNTHNSIEEPVIYPQADKILTATASNELSAFLDTGRMPDGWVCEKAAA